MVVSSFCYCETYIWNWYDLFGNNVKKISLYLVSDIRGTNIQNRKLWEKCHSIWKLVYFYQVQLGKFIFV